MGVELPFFGTVSKEAYDAYLIAQYMMNNPNVSIGRAAFQLSKGTWDAARLANGLAKVSEALKIAGGVGGDFAQVEAVIAHGQAAAAGTAGAGGAGIVTRVLTNVGRGVLRIFGRQAVAGSAAALGTGILVTTAVLGTAVYFGANAIGSRSGDASIQAGSSMNRPVSTAVAGPGVSGTDKVAVFLLPDNSGGTIWIGQEATLRTLRACDLPNGGLCDDPNQTYPMVNYVKESADFDTYDQAVANLCSVGTLEPGYWGQKIAAYGGHYWFEGSCP